MISYASISISFVMPSPPGALFFFSKPMASSSLDIDMISLISSYVERSWQGVNSDRSGSVVMYSDLDRSSKVSLGLSV